MYIQEDLTTTPHEVHGISWELSDELLSKFRQYLAFSKLIFNDDKTEIIDIVEDEDKKQEFEAEARKEQEEKDAEKKAQEYKALENKGIATMAHILFNTYAADMSSDEIIQCRALADEWTPRAYEIGDIRTENGMPYRCVQAHDSSAQKAAWSPSKAESLWAVYHGTSKDTALPWVNPTGAHDIYKAGECMVWTDGSVMQCVQDTNFSPEDVPSAWKEI